jgi:preprotein translocase subunit SecA
MIGYIIKKIVGSKNDREVRKLRPMVAQINEIEATLQSKPDEYLREKTVEWKTRCAAIQEKEELRKTLDEILPEAFAVVKNACRRLWGSEITVRDHPL